MKHQFHRIDGSMICEIEAETQADAISKAVRAGISFAYADLTGADITRANCIGADLTGADLTRANCIGADIPHANLTGADLTGADLTGAGLTGADLTGANLTGADITGADITGANCIGANCIGANCIGADITDADITGANLTGADLTRANLTDEHAAITVLARTTRIIDPYEFFLWATDNGPLIRAGCRTMTPEEYRAHIATYTDDAKREETAAILDFFDGRWAAYGRKGKS